MYYIGLDIGTSGCKASIVDGTGNIVAYAHQAYSVSTPQPGYIEIDARLIWEKTKETLREAVRNANEFGIMPEQLIALAVASFGEAVVLVDENGNPTEPSIYFSDIRGSEEVADIADSIDVKAIFRTTGMPPNPMFSANKLLWINKHRPEALEKAKYLMLFGDFIAFRLTGERVIDYSLASRTMLFDVNNYKWAEEIIRILGLPTDKFSTPAQAGTQMGSVLPSVAADLGLPNTLIVVVGGHDQALAALGSGAIHPGEAIDGMGSTECLTTVIDKGSNAYRMAEYNYCREPHVFPGAFITLAFNASAGTAIAWFKDKFFSAQAKVAASRGENIYRIMDRACPSEPTSLLCLPFVGGSGTPYFDLEVGATFVGMTLTTDIPQIYKAILEGICYELRFNIDLLDSIGIAPNEIRVVGGSSQSDVMMQIKADVLNRDVQVLKNWEIGTIALAALCAMSMGEAGAILENARANTSVSHIYEPNQRNVEIYNRKMEQYRNLYHSVKRLATI